MKVKDFTVSVVIPVMNEEGNIKKIAQKLTSLLVQYSDYEILFVDDGSSDGSLDILKQQNRFINVFRSASCDLVETGYE